STTRSAAESRALAIARGFEAGRNSTDRTVNRSMALSLFASAGLMAVASCPGTWRRVKRNADGFHGRGRGACIIVRHDGREDRPPGQSLHDRTFRPLRPRRRAGIQL